jgi:gluconate 2-dehydrogenase alpha chain
MKTLAAVDVAIIGGGWSGLLMAKELGARTPLSVVVLERGGQRGIDQYLLDMDEIDYGIRFRMMQQPSEQTVTLRHTAGETALPVRQYGSFLPGAGVGGAGEHWTGICDRPLPDNFELRTRTIETYGEKKLPEGNSVQDWGITYSELEPFYARVDALLGISGKSGNLRGQRVQGGNPFEGSRSTDYPTPPMRTPYLGDIFRKAATSLGYHPYPIPGATISTTYTNPDGVTRAGCSFCGFCERFGCMIGAKAQPTNTLLPVIANQKGVSIRTQTWVRRIVHQNGGTSRNATGVTYRDATGAEYFQPARVVILASWSLNNVRLLFLSQIGKPYNQTTGEGTLGRNLTHQVAGATQAFFEKPLNRFMGAGAAGMTMADLDGDVFDHSNLPFLRGGLMTCAVGGGRPVTTFGAVPRSVKSRWGAEWKKTAVHYFDRTGGIGYQAEHLAYKTNFMDLDPTYRDLHGDPLLRLTLNWHDNERKMLDFGLAKATEIAKAMGAVEVNPFPGLKNYDATRYQTTHVQGGAIMGTSPENSVVNTYLQHWDMPNLFVLGGSAFPQNFSAHPTMTILGLAYRTADALIERYLKRPGALA